MWRVEGEGERKREEGRREKRDVWMGRNGMDWNGMGRGGAVDAGRGVCVYVNGMILVMRLNLNATWSSGGGIVPYE